ncbi:MAG: 3-oxoacyl-ACP reductase [Hyphomicrobiales bacterium]|nr:3-oxoacyl-ACP reductase [Hyphomicrobiales bacterium]
MSTSDRGLALVTGASYGVGAAVAKALARDGWRVAITATKIENCAATAEAITAAGGSCLPCALDLRSQDSIAALVARLWSEAPVRALVNNAGVNLRRDAVEVSREDWDEVMLANLTGTFFLTQAVGKRLIEAGLDGSIVTVSSSHGMLGAPQRSTYGISKAGLIQMVRMLAVEWGPKNIRLNALAPGRLETDSPSRAASGSDPVYMGKMLSKIPLGRFATGEDVGAMAAFLAGPGGRSITGQVIAIDGGLSAA